jgi:hypothetical protein
MNFPRVSRTSLFAEDDGPRPQMTALARKCMENELRRHEIKLHRNGKARFYQCERCRGMKHRGKCVGASKNPLLRAA